MVQNYKELIEIPLILKSTVISKQPLTRDFSKAQIASGVSSLVSYHGLYLYYDNNNNYNYYKTIDVPIIIKIIIMKIIDRVTNYKSIGILIYYYRSRRYIVTRYTTLLNTWQPNIRCNNDYYFVTKRLGI